METIDEQEELSVHKKDPLNSFSYLEEIKEFCKRNQYRIWSTS